MLLRMAALGEGVVGIALKEELNCGYQVVLGPGAIRVCQCRQGRKGRRVFLRTLWTGYCELMKSVVALQTGY